MRRLFTFAAVALAFTLTFTSCMKDEETTTTTDTDTETTDPEEETPSVYTFVPTMSESDITTFLTSYSDDVVVSRYKNLVHTTKTLLTAVQAIDPAATGDDAADQMEAACEAWKDARVAWERTEAYLFGPVDNAGIDPGIDSWPLDLSALAESIQGWTGSTDNIETLMADGGDLKGFHAIEFLLFCNGDAKVNINQFDHKEDGPDFGTDYGFGRYAMNSPTAEELQVYLEAVTNEVYRCVLLLEGEWNYDGMDDENKTDAEAFGSYYELTSEEEGGYSEGKYAEIFKSAGASGNNLFKSQETAIQQILQGAYGIAEEVGTAKIGDPITSGSVLEVESWFSYNSVLDFTDNIRGIKEAYIGVQIANDGSDTYTVEPTDNSLSAYVKSGSEVLDAEVITAIDAAIKAVEAMPTPFRDNLTLSTENQAAIDACLALQAVLEKVESAITEGTFVPAE